MPSVWPARARELAAYLVESGGAAVWQELKTYGLKMGIFQKLVIHCRHIVCSPANRDRYGCNPHDVHELTADHAEIGWSNKLFDGIVTDVDHECRDDVIEYNIELVASSDGMLAPIEPDETKYMTMAGSHTNQGHRQVYIYIYIYQ